VQYCAHISCMNRWARTMMGTFERSETFLRDTASTCSSDMFTDCGQPYACVDHHNSMRWSRRGSRLQVAAAQVELIECAFAKHTNMR
jgi:hypothetical protein